MEGPERQSAVSHTDGGVRETLTTGWVESSLLEGLLVAAGHGGVVRWVEWVTVVGRGTCTVWCNICHTATTHMPPYMAVFTNKSFGL